VRVFSKTGKTTNLEITVLDVAEVVARSMGLG
jgi:hypothetical protein